MSDETKKQDQETVDAAEDRIGEALEKFGNEAEAALTEIRGVAKSLKDSLTKDVLARATEQSKVMASTEAELAALRVRFDDQKIALDTLSSSMAKLDAAVKETKRRMGEQGEAVKKVLATARSIEEKAGDLFGRKLDALASQVAPLAAMGKRLEAVELVKKSWDEAFGNLSRRVVELSDGIDSATRDLAALRSVVEQLQLPKAEKPKAKAEVKSS